MEASHDATVAAAAALLRRTKESGGSLLVLTGAGMSVSSGVPVFRSADGSMSAEFVAFLAAYNAARRAAGLEDADDWFSFSVPEMFRRETEAEAWAYWRWRTLRALVEPAPDYTQLSKLLAYFEANAFVQTSNCDQLHVRAALSADRVMEIHGSLGRVQCAAGCTQRLWPVDGEFLERLRAEPEWVPRCSSCKTACLRPNVMIFMDGSFVDSELQRQQTNLRDFEDACADGLDVNADKNAVVLEIGAGVVVPSIRSTAEHKGSQGVGLIRVNPSREACEQMQVSFGPEALGGKYFPLAMRGAEAMERLTAALGI